MAEKAPGESQRMVTRQLLMDVPSVSWEGRGLVLAPDLQKAAVVQLGCDWLNRGYRC